MFETWVFYVFAVILLLAGVRVITARNPVHAALFLWIRATFPRYRYDQIMRLGWKVFIPLTLVWIVVVGVWMQTPWSPWK